jgi:hypothetical protein
MELRNKAKTALDEARAHSHTWLAGSRRISVSRCLQDAYEQLPVHARYLNGVAPILILGATSLLTAPAVGPPDLMLSHGFSPFFKRPERGGFLLPKRHT